jgi:hypothetical protein
VTENQSGEVGTAEPAVGPAEPEAVGPVPVPKKSVRRGRVAAIAGSALLALAVLGGVGYTAVTVHGADRDAGAPVWRFPAAPADRTAPADKGLRGMLLPYATSGYVRGPDIGQFGSDAELSGREATALRKQEISGLPRTQRLLLERQIDREHIRGMALRSYLNTSWAADSTVAADHAFTIDVVLSQMDEESARDIVTYQHTFLDALTSLRKGPTVKGHKNAQCFLPPKAAGEKLTGMVCSAYEGDVLVSLTASGGGSMDPKGVALFLSDQLDRVKTTGRAV